MRTRSGGVLPAASSELTAGGAAVRIGLAVLVVCLVGGCFGGDSQKPLTLGPPHALELVDVASEVGLDFRQGAFRWDVSGDPAAMLGGGVCWLDYDDDGWLDLFAVNSYAEQEVARWKTAGGLPRTALFHNEAGKFEDVSAGSGADIAVRGNGCVAADLDLDGDTDLYVTTARSQVLLWNEGGGKFEEGARPAGVDAYGWRTGAAVGDVDGDGWPDLFVAGYADVNGENPAGTAGFPSTKLGVRDLLFLSNGRHDGAVTFREVGRQVGLEVSKFEYGLGALFTDLEGDGDLDLYLANDTNPDRLYENVRWPGGAKADPAGLGFRFEERAGPAGVADPGAGMGVAAGDYDGDGRSDLFVTNGRGQVHGVFRSNLPDENDPSYTDVRADLGPDFTGSVGWGVTWADLDLDTDLDLLEVNGDIPVTDLSADAEPLKDYVNENGSLFVDASASSGLDAVGDLLARGSAAADYDNDGDIDFAVSQIGGPLVLLENEVSGENWLEVALDGFHPGAVVSILLPDGRTLQREARAGGSYLSSEDPRCLFGLGDATEVKEISVRWPDGEGTHLHDVKTNQIVQVKP
jgi:ASPIC and UnbV/FG-GAP-like repeat